jgi:hypothetical protein
MELIDATYVAAGLPIRQPTTVAATPTAPDTWTSQPNPATHPDPDAPTNQPNPTTHPDPDAPEPPKSD